MLKRAQTLKRARVMTPEVPSARRGEAGASMKRTNQWAQICQTHNSASDEVAGEA